jgi:hypothetical protein
MKAVILIFFVVYFSLIVNARWAPEAEDDDELDVVGTVDAIELKLATLSSRAFHKSNATLKFNDHAKGWAGVLNCNGVLQKGCNTFYGPTTRWNSHFSARRFSAGGTPIYHDRHGEYPHYHLAGHKCVYMKVDCWKNGKPQMMWVNPHFWVLHDDVDNCPQCTYKRTPGRRNTI